MMTSWVRIPVACVLGAAVFLVINQTSSMWTAEKTGGPSPRQAQDQERVPPLTEPYIDPKISDQWAAMHLDSQGQYFVRNFDSTIQKMDSSGLRLWSFSTGSLSELPPLDIRATTLAGSGTLIGVGITVANPAQTVIFRVRDLGSRAAVESIGTYDIEPWSIAVAPSELIYVYGLVPSKVNEALHALSSGTVTKTIETPVLHEIAAGGDIIRSMLVRRMEVHSAKEVIEFVSETVRVAVDSEGLIYLYKPYEMVLEKFDLDSELITGRAHLPYSGMLNPMLRGLEFVDSSTVLYSVTHREENRLAETQTWLFNIETGQSSMVLRSPKTAAEAHFDSESGEIVVSTGVGSAALPRQFERFSDWEIQDISVAPRVRSGTQQ